MIINRSIKNDEDEANSVIIFISMMCCLLASAQSRRVSIVDLKENYYSTGDRVGKYIVEAAPHVDYNGGLADTIFSIPVKVKYKTGRNMVKNNKNYPFTNNNPERAVLSNKLITDYNGRRYGTEFNFNQEAVGARPVFVTTRSPVLVDTGFVAGDIYKVSFWAKCRV